MCKTQCCSCKVFRHWHNNVGRNFAITEKVQLISYQSAEAVHKILQTEPIKLSHTLRPLLNHSSLCFLLLTQSRMFNKWCSLPLLLWVSHVNLHHLHPLWYVDSSTSNHTTCSRAILTSLTPYDGPSEFTRLMENVLLGNIYKHLIGNVIFNTNH